ncbi:MAG TPA: methylated-DNA--[protein]-cysteine S-methyltransferase [Cyclobacteriaceae bacterium]|nr:methylated-DNA--[protein]-cysteine S-methyltransferase [Cyclobacteriaceae bacterium]
MNGLAYYSSPVGELEIQSQQDAITLVGFLRALKRSEHHTPVIQTCIRELDEYFFKGRKSFEVRIELRGSAFQQSVWNKLLEIPYGKTTYYADIASKVGDLNAVRAVGLANGQNPIVIIVPCHRVIGKDGSLVGYGGGLERKIWLLRHEGAFNQLDLF